MAMIEPEEEVMLSETESERQELMTGKPEEKVYRVLHNSGVFNGVCGRCMCLHLQVPGTPHGLRCVVWRNAVPGIQRLQLVSGSIITGLAGKFDVGLWNMESLCMDSPPLSGFSQCRLLVDQPSKVAKLPCHYPTAQPFKPHGCPGEYCLARDVPSLPTPSLLKIDHVVLRDWRELEVAERVGYLDYTHCGVLKDEAGPEDAEGVTVWFLGPRARSIATHFPATRELMITLHNALWTSGEENKTRLYVTEHTHVFFKLI